MKSNTTSPPRETKDDHRKKAFVLTHLMLGDHICMIGAVRYLATQYDSVTVVCKDVYKSNIEKIYKDDPSIEFYVVRNDHEIGVNWGLSKEKFEQITEGYDVFTCGHHWGNPYRKSEDLKMYSIYDTVSPYREYYDAPFDFYDHMGLDRSVFWDYFHIAEQDEDLFIKYLQNISYVFVHYSSSTTTKFDIAKVENLFKLNKLDTLFINPCENVYNEHDAFFDIAQKLINYPIAYYKTVIEKASKIIVTDSCFFCMAIALKTDARQIHVNARNHANYCLPNLTKLNDIIFWS
jgi:hypothetical protein